MKKNAHGLGHDNSTSPLFELDGHPFMDWVSRHGQTILYAILGVFGALLAAYFWLSGGSTLAEKDFQVANEQFNLFQQDSSSADSSSPQEEALIGLTQLLKNHPDLQAKYEARIAQILIDRNQAEKAKPFAHSVFERVGKDDQPFYVEYAQITLLVAANQYEEAIKRSIALKEQMIAAAQNDQSENIAQAPGGMLFASNLLRIAFLQQRVGASAAEYKSWEEWKSMTSSTNRVAIAPNIDRKPFFTLAQLFSDGTVSLDQYIDMRLQKLAALQEK